MASSPSPAPGAAALDYQNSTTAKTNETNTSYYDVEAVTTTVAAAAPPTSAAATLENKKIQNSSSPLLAVSAMKRKSIDDQENFSPSKFRHTHTRVRSGTELSPLKILSEKHGRSSDGSMTMGPPARTSSTSPRKLAPESSRFPVKISTNPLEETPRLSHDNDGRRSGGMTIEQAVRENDGLKRAIDIFEDDESMLEVNRSLLDDDDTPVYAHTTATDDVGDETVGPDDISTFSTFSAIPDMTMFAKLRQSPTKSVMGGVTPRGASRFENSVMTADAASSRPSSSSRRDTGNTSNLLIDFTDQLRNPQRSPAKRSTRPSPLGGEMGTPSRQQLSNLLDFDIPPMPTPRSVPSVTPRELESLKSKLLSEISSLKASLSGKEAEVQSLKTAVGDAEKRAGESLEQLREEQIAKDELAQDKLEWENRGREMEAVLRKIKDEVVHSEREREELEQKLDESEKRREAAEMLHQEAESKMAGMRAGRESERSSSSPDKTKTTAAAAGNSHEIEIAVERVARELHGLYKSKHETKVAALKKSYECRWQKKIDELETRIGDLTQENEKLRLERHNNANNNNAASSAAELAKLKAQSVKDSACIKELEANVHQLEAMVTTVQKDNGDLRGMLEQERVEKGELVLLAEEMMRMQTMAASQQQEQQSLPPPPVAARTSAPVQPSSPIRRSQPPSQPSKTPKADFRSSVSRASGLRAPMTGGLRSGAAAQGHERMKSAGGLPRPGGGRSGIMNSIEKMGSYNRGRE